MNKKRVIYIGILLIVTVIVSITTFSYAYLTRLDEQHGKLNMVVGTLEYELISTDLTNNSITLSAYEVKEIEITIRSLNEIESKYELYTNNVENVTIGYLEENGFDISTGTIAANGIKKVKIALESNSDTSKIITFGVQGGFTSNNTITLDTGRIAIAKGETLCNITPGTAYEFSYTGNVQTFTARCVGDYQIELWGAQGDGKNSTYSGGNGGYTGGIIDLNRNSRLYIYVGEYPNNGTDGVVTYNGGGTKESWSGNDVNGTQTIYSGGGATDVRLASGEWNDFESLKSRIMVAAGGGGGGYVSGQSKGGTGGQAGGLQGYNGINYATDYGYGQMYIGTGATQTSGGQSIIGTNTSTTGILGSGNSGGYYGGGIASRGHGASGGGSSFISGYNGCNAINTTTSTSSNIVHTSSSILNYNGDDYTFVNGVMIDGKGCNWSTGSATNCGANQPQPDGTMTVGHSGNGYARITYLGSEYTITFNAGDGIVSESTRKIYEANPMGTLPTPTKTGYLFSGWYLEDSFINIVDANYIVNSDITLYAKYTPITYTIRFNSNGGAGTMNNQTFNYDEIKALSTNTYTKSGKTFAGWSTNSSSTFTNLIARASQTANLTQTATGTWYVDYTTSNKDTYIVFATATGNEIVAGEYYTLFFKVSGLTANANVTYGFPDSGSNVVKLRNGMNKIKFNSWASLNFNRYVFDDNLRDATQKFYVSDFILFKDLGDDYYDGESITNLTTTNGAVIDLYAIWK